jgi:hypothetical protein
VVLESLMGGAEVPSSMQGSSEFTPVCCITLEPLLCPVWTSNLVEILHVALLLENVLCSLYCG